MKPVPLEVTMMKRIGELKAENARLKADVNELADGLKLASKVGIKMADEVERLKAEVERLKKFSDEAMAHIAKEERKSRERLDMAQAEVERLTEFTTRTIIPNEELQAQVERLTKAGDAMCKSIDDNGCHDNGDWDECLEVMKRWNAAKEGKGQP